MTSIDLESAGASIQGFYGGKMLKERIRELEALLTGTTVSEITGLLASQSIDQSILTAALDLKAVAAQINVVVHAVGLMTALPIILDPDETVTYVSLGAGNAGMPFDLETDKRVAEFKFINWQGGAEVVRQNQLFKDFFYLAEYDGHKRRCLYVLDIHYPLKFLNGRRVLQSVLNSVTLKDAFYGKYDQRRYTVVSDYYRDHKDRVELIGL